VAWVNVVFRYRDGTSVTLTQQNLQAEFEALPQTGVVRIDIEEPTPGATGGFERVVSGGTRYWGTRLSGNEFEIGTEHRARFADGVEVPNSRGALSAFVLDKRPNRDIVESPTPTDVPVDGGLTRVFSE